MIKIFIVWSLVTGFTAGYAQSRSAELLKAYNDQDYQLLERLFTDTKKIEISGQEWDFYSALYTADGEVAKEKFQQVFDVAQGQLKKMAAKKIMDYYYAKGYYINAGKYQQYLVDKDYEPESQTIISESEEPQNQQLLKTPEGEESSVTDYFIQVGAFSLEENAEQLKKMLSTQNVNTTIVKRDVNGKSLFCVWIPGKNTFEQTLQFANNIKEKYELKFRIIKQ